MKKSELKPWTVKEWCIPNARNGDFTAKIERVPEVYKQPYDPRFPVVCMDESLKQLKGDVKEPVRLKPGSPAKRDYEYERQGMCNIFMANEPLAGKRYVELTLRKTKQDWAQFLKEIAKEYEGAEKITLVMDNLVTHKHGSLYETFPPEEAKAPWDRFNFVYTPVHGSCLNMEEIELRVKCANESMPGGKN